MGRTHEKMEVLIESVASIVCVCPKAEILDAKCHVRSSGVEEEVLNAGKKLVFVLNKIDLVESMTIVTKWEKYLSRSFPTIPFRSKTSSSRSKKTGFKFSQGKATAMPAKLITCGYEALGASELMNLLKNYTRTDKDTSDTQRPVKDVTMGEETGAGEKHQQQLFKNITVCVVGMPNVGKSSIINSLCRNTNKLKTGNEPGITRHNARIKLTDHLQLLDTPGVVMDGNEDDPAAVLRGCVKVTNDSHDDVLTCMTIAFTMVTLTVSLGCRTAQQRQPSWQWTCYARYRRWRNNFAPDIMSVWRRV